MTEPLLLAHLNLDVDDVERSIVFYESQLGLPVTRLNGTARVRWESFLLVLAPGKAQASDGFHFGFRVESPAEVDAWAEQLRTHGVALLSEPADAGTVRVFRVADPDGYTIEIFTFIG
jgi:catechol 2,3-dioxygenase-like lactoylglutathione lyase family enzyme